MPRSPDDQTLRELLVRAADPESLARWEKQVRAAGYCEHPVRLKGRILRMESLGAGQNSIAYTTSAEPDGWLLKACGNRRAAVCAPCSARYKADAWQLVAAGLRGGKGIPVTVGEHPAVFATLTAPSFGAVHAASERSGHQPICSPRRGAGRCPHGRPIACWERHPVSELRVGSPICVDCFDYRRAVLWNARAPELWRRTTIYIKRALARRCGLPQRDLAADVRLSYMKVAEFQRRGAVHCHAVIRLDGAEAWDGAVSTPPARFTTELLMEAVGDAVSEVTAPSPDLQIIPSNLGWGRELHLRRIAVDGDPDAAAAASYIAKYVTKSTEGALGSVGADGEHARRYLEALDELAKRPSLAHLRLHRAADAFGYGGHWTTKSRRYSTTFGALRRARADFARRRSGESTASSAQAREVQAEWAFLGTGYRTEGDRLLAATAAAGVLEQRRVARLERRTSVRARG